MLIDSWYDPYLGVVILVRVIDGVVKNGSADPADGGRTAHHEIDRVGVLHAQAPST